MVIQPDLANGEQPVRAGLHCLPDIGVEAVMPVIRLVGVNALGAVDARVGADQVADGLQVTRGTVMVIRRSILTASAAMTTSSTGSP